MMPRDLDLNPNTNDFYSTASGTVDANGGMSLPGRIIVPAFDESHPVTANSLGPVAGGDGSDPFADWGWLQSAAEAGSGTWNSAAASASLSPAPVSATAIVNEASVGLDPSTAAAFAVRSDVGPVLAAPAAAAVAPLASAGLIINLVWDASAQNAPQSFRDGVQSAANVLQAAFTNPITVNMEIGYGEWANQDFGLVATAEGGPISTTSESYSALRSQLANHATTADVTQAVNSLPNTSSLQGVSSFEIAAAQEKAFGVLTANAGAIDGAVGIGTSITGNELIAVALHEMTHAMGRVVGGFSLDLFRYSSVGQHLFSTATPAPPSYLSLDNGATKLADFGQSSDPSDFLNGGAQDSGIGTGADPFDEFYGSNSFTSLTQVDQTTMGLLGFSRVAASVTISLALPIGRFGSYRIVTATAPLTGMADPGATVTLLDGTTKIASTTANSSGNWSLSPSLPNGNHSITASETTTAGTLASSAAVSFATATTASFTQSLANYSEQSFGDSNIAVTGPDGKEAVFGITSFAFSDGTVFTSGANGLVDPFYYDRQNADVYRDRDNPAQHYAQYGWHEGRNPSGFFSTNGYLDDRPDVAAAGTNPLTHYDQHGWKEGSNPSALFDTQYYLVHNPDVATDPLQHYLKYGLNEGRAILPAIGQAGQITSDDFDPQYYRLAYPTSAPQGVDAWSDFDRVGWHVGRNPNGLFDVNYYLVNNPDVAAGGADPVTHYAEHGWKEGRNPSALFNTNAYLAANPDVAAANVDPLHHFLVNGVYEGRQP